MNKLIITAHPNPKGFTHLIAAEFKKYSEKKHQVKVIDLYNEERKQDFLMLTEENKTSKDPLRAIMQEQIARADELIFIFPMWRYDAPAILKNWFDVNMTSGFAFRYKKGLVPERLLVGKTARIFVTTGSPAWMIYTLGIGTYIIWALARCRYVGISLKSYTVFGSMPTYRTAEDRQKMLDKVASIANR